jgi:hypothetical protein
MASSLAIGNILASLVCGSCTAMAGDLQVALEATEVAHSVLSAGGQRRGMNTIGGVVSSSCAQQMVVVLDSRLEGADVLDSTWQPREQAKENEIEV